MNFYVFVLITLFACTISFVSSQNLLGNIISLSVNQPCTDIDASLTNSTEKLGCSLSTILQIGLSPEFANTSSSVTYTFRAFPDSTGTYQQNFGTPSDQNNPLDPNNLCSNPGSTSCKTALENENLFTLKLSLTPINTRWKLINTGLIIPSAYYYQTRPYTINSAMPQQACGIDPYSDVPNNAGGYNYAKPVNTIIIDKNNISSSSFPLGTTPFDVYAQYLLSNYVYNVPGQNLAPANNCSNPLTECTFGATTFVDGEFSNQFGSSTAVLDAIYNRWLNGTLGCGQAVSQNRIPVPASFEKSHVQCTQAISPTGSSNSWTTNVCPGNPLPSFKARNNNIYPSYCVNGPCGGDTEPFCALVAGFQFGFSRCLMSRKSAVEFLLPLTNDPLSGCTIDLINFEPYTDSNSAAWYKCLQSAYTFYADKFQNPPPQDLIKDFFNATDAEVCGAFLQLLSFPEGGDVTQSCPYPNLVHIVADGNTCYSPSNNEWRNSGGSEAPFVVSNTNQFITPFQDYTPSSNLIPAGFCGSAGPGPDANQRISPTISTSPCECTGANGWQDTVIPIGPLCSVYRLENPGEPIYELTVIVEDNSGNECIRKIGPVSGEDGSSKLSAACNGTVASFIINVDKPRGNVLPPMEGLIVVCGSITDDNPQSTPIAEPFFGGSDPLGSIDPYASLDETRPYRTPLPSTFRDAFSTSGSVPTTNDQTNCTKDALGSCAWWYYVPPNEVNQFCESCNCNGWINYGVQSPQSTTLMCNNPAGTCVPGYDIRNYNAKRYDQNASGILDGFPEKWPTTKTPLFVARTFVDFEIDQKDTPVNLPPGWNVFKQGYFIQNGFLYSNLNYYSNGNIFIRTKIAVAGQLIAESTSFSTGQFCYPPTEVGGDDICGAASTNINNQPYGACSVYVNSGDGTLFTIVHNTGTQVGTYTILGNCTNGASLEGQFDFSVAPNAYQSVNIPLNYITTTGETIVCTIDLYMAFVNQKLDTIQYTCPKFENRYSAPGTQVYGTENNQLGGIYDPPYTTANSGNSCGGDNPPWYCFGSRGIGSLMASLWSLIFLILFIVGIVVFFEEFDRYIKKQTLLESTKATRERNVFRNETAKLDAEIQAEKSEEKLEKKLTDEQKLQQKIIDRITQKPEKAVIVDSKAPSQSSSESNNSKKSKK